FIKVDANDGGRTRIPALKEEREGVRYKVEDNKKKGRIFHQAFFKENPSPLPSFGEVTYDAPRFEVKRINNHDIRAVIKMISPYKAPGPNGVANTVFTHNPGVLVPFLGPIFQATFETNHYPARWKLSRTVVLRKPGRTDYGLAGSYRPIALMDTMAKILAACVCNAIMKEVEKQGLLPANQFG
ncbi:hypothetical protein FA15DRAFT_549796, partial [Coprinopsis marcescibilis]